MNFNSCKEYRFVQGTLVSTESGKVYNFRLDRNDRFYSYMKPHISAGGVQGQTKVMIDTLTIEKTDKSFLDEKSFTLNALILAKDNTDTVWAYEITINKIKMNYVDVSKLSYENGDLVCTLYEMELPYHTKINITERVD